MPVRPLSLGLALLCACGSTAGPARGTPAATPTAPSEPVAAPPEAAPSPPGPRLPAGVHASHYDAFLDVDPEDTRFRGLVRVELDVERPLPLLWLSAEGLVVKSATVEGAKARWFAAPGGWLAVAPAHQLLVGSATVELGYEGSLDPVRSQGLYRVEEPDGKWFAYTYFAPGGARRVFPCLDEPGEKAPWKLAIRTPAANLAVASMRALSDRSENGHRLVEFAESRPLPSHLVGFAVGPFEIVDAGVTGTHGTPLRFVVPPGHDEELRYARETAPRALALLEDVTGMAYPFGKLDVVVVPRYWGTGEHAGLLALGQPLALVPPAAETLERKRSLARVLVRELAHGWFGDYVSVAWWDELWLDEGLGTWMELALTPQLEPSFGARRERQRLLSAALHADASASAAPLRQPIGQAGEVAAGARAAKGAAILFMFERWLGDDRLLRGVRRYLVEHAFASVVSEDLIGAISTEAASDLSGAMKSFIDQPGAPVVALELVCGAGQAPRVRLAQERSAARGAASPLWQIPMCLRWGQGAAKKAQGAQCDVLASASAEWPLAGAGACPDWLLGNADHAGYYFSAYTRAGRTALARVQKRALSAEERYGLLFDTDAQVAAGQVGLGELLALAPAMLDDTDGLVAGAARAALAQIDPDALPAPLLPAYRRMIGKLLGPAARRLGWSERPGESSDDHERRAAIVPLVATWADDARLRDEAGRLARAWLSDRRAVAAPLVDDVLAVAARAGDRGLFDAYLAAARQSQDREQRRRLLGALAAFRDAPLVAAAQALALADEFDPRDAQLLLFAGLREAGTRELAWEFVKAHHDEVAARAGDDLALESLAAVGGFCDAAHRQDVEAFFRSRVARIDGGPHALAEVLDRIDRCVAQRDRNAPEIAAFLAKF